MTLNIYRKGLSKKAATVLATLSAERKEIFAIKDIQQVSGKKMTGLWKLLNYLLKNRWIERIERGKYLIIPLEAGAKPKYVTHPFLIAQNLVSPYYIGFLSALNHYGITEQISKTVYIVTTKKKLLLTFGNDDYYFVKFSKKRFFAADEEWIGNSKFNISSKEKTVVDCLFIPEYSGGLTEVVKAFREKLDYERLYDYAIKMDDLAAIKRLGYILDTLKIKTPVLGKLLSRSKGGYCLLDTGGPKTGSKNKKWRIIENISKEDLLVEV